MMYFSPKVCNVDLVLGQKTDGYSCLALRRGDEGLLRSTSLAPDIWCGPDGKWFEGIEPPSAPKITISEQTIDLVLARYPYMTRDEASHFAAECLTSAYANPDRQKSQE